MALQEDWQTLPSAVGERARVHRTGGNNNTVLVGLNDHAEPGELQRDRHLPKAVEPKASTGGRPWRWIVSSPTLGGFTTSTATFGSGQKTAGTRATTGIQGMAAHGQPGPKIAVFVSCAEAPGSSVLVFSAPRPASHLDQLGGPTFTASGWPER